MAAVGIKGLTLFVLSVTAELLVILCELYCCISQLTVCDRETNVVLVVTRTSGASWS